MSINGLFRSVACVGIMSSVWACVSWLHADADFEGWTELRSQYVYAYFDKGLSLKYLDKKIDLKTDFLSSQLWLNQSNDLHEMIKSKLDVIFRRTQNILDMHPRNVHVRLIVYKSKRDFERQYRMFYAKNFTDWHIDESAFYRYKDNTIYMHVSALRTGVLAHEMAHCIIDHYFIVLPPVKVQELLAMHADKEFYSI